MQAQTTKPVSVPPREPFQFLEREFAAWIGYKPEQVVACASGSAALLLALEAFCLPSGSAVLCPDYTMIACPRAIVMAGLEPVLVDCRDDLLMDWQIVDNHGWGKVDPPAIMPVHVYGRNADVGAIRERYPDSRIIEDLAEGHGIPPCPDADAAAYSFFRNKIVCAADAEGGAVVFRNPEHAWWARSLRCLGFTEDHDYEHEPRGWNHRLSNPHAQLIRRSLSEVDWNIEQRRTIEGWYDRYCPDEWKMPRRDAVWVYDLRIKGMDREAQSRVVRTLKANGIQARHGFKPMSWQKEFIKMRCRVIGNGNASRLASEILYLPCQPGITTEADAERSFGIIRRSL